MGCGAKPTAVMAPMNPEHTIFCPACATEFNETQDCQPDHSCGRVNGCFGMDLGVPLFHNRTIVAQPVDLGAVSNNYTAEVRTFLSNAAAALEPFFLYYAASHVHVPQNHDPRWDEKIPSTPFAHRTNGGKEFAAALMEMDDEMGNLMKGLDENGVQKETLIMVTGDNGNWECKCNLTGSHGPFAGLWQKDNGGGSSSKCTLFEAGHREVGIFRWLGTIKPGVTGVIASSLDYMPTIASLTGLKLPSHGSSGLLLRFDGIDLSGVILHGDNVAHTSLFHVSVLVDMHPHTKPLLRIENNAPQSEAELSKSKSSVLLPQQSLMRDCVAVLRLRSWRLKRNALAERRGRIQSNLAARRCGVCARARVSADRYSRSQHRVCVCYHVYCSIFRCTERSWIAGWNDRSLAATPRERNASTGPKTLHFCSTSLLTRRRKEHWTRRRLHMQQS